MISTKSNFKTASEAFDYFYIKIKDKGVDFDNTKALFNVGFYIHNPSDKQIKAGYRKWNQKYAAAEWAWYLSGNRNISKLGELYGKVPEIWKRMADANGNVNSNYGWQWNRENQLGKVSVYMRSNDLWYGFCNDQYQFASLQEMVADRLSIPTGWYYHHAHNLHLYNDKLK